MGAFRSLSISHPLVLNLYGLIQNSVSSGLTSAWQGGPTAPSPSEVILTVQPFPVVSPVTGSFMLLHSTFLERGNPLPFMHMGKFCIFRKEFVSVGKNMLILQTRKHKYESALTQIQESWIWMRLLGSCYQRLTGETSSKSEWAHFWETEDGF